MNQHDQSGTLIYPPTSHADEISVALKALACMRHSGRTIYVAAPITGGPRFVEWFSTEGRELATDRHQFQSALQNAVVEPNSRRAASVVRDLKCGNSALFVDPSMLFIDSWSQDDYRHFWCRVIESFVEQAIFLDGWHLSSGCAFEFLVSAVKKLPVYSQSGELLSVHDGLQLMEDGFRELSDIGVDTGFFQSVLVQLHAFERAGEA